MDGRPAGLAEFDGALVALIAVFVLIGVPLVFAASPPDTCIGTANAIIALGSTFDDTVPPTPLIAVDLRALMRDVLVCA